LQRKMSKRAKYILEFLATMNGNDFEVADFEVARNLWAKHSDDLVRRMHKKEVLRVYEVFEKHGMESEKSRLYDLATRYNHPASQKLIAMKYITGYR